MPGPSDTAANDALQCWTRAGGSWEIVLLSTRPDAHSAGGTVISDFSPVSVPRNSATWAAPASRQVHMAVDVSFGTASADVVAVAWLLRDSSHNPVQSALLAGGGMSIVAGSVVTLAGSQVILRVP